MAVPGQARRSYDKPIFDASQAQGIQALTAPYIQLGAAITPDHTNQLIELSYSILLDAPQNSVGNISWTVFANDRRVLGWTTQDLRGGNDSFHRAYEYLIFYDHAPSTARLIYRLSVFSYSVRNASVLTGSSVLVEAL